MKPKRHRPDRAERRRPRQSRSNQTARALREAFVQLLVEHGYAAITVREITGVAGTALGSFYDYFAGKEDLARVSLHLRSKALLQALRGIVARHRGESLVDMVSAIVDALLTMHREHPEEWAAHYLMERRFTGLTAYRKMYARFVDAWEEAITTTRDWPAGQPARDAAGVCQALLYGLVTHAYLTRSNAPSRPNANILRQQIITAIAAYLRVARDEAARH